MMPLSYFGSEVLREPAQPVIKVSAEIKKLIEEMFETNKAANGVGLAAPQVGVGKRVVIIDLSHTGIEPFALVNPVLSRCRGSAEDSEGCLSLPGIFLPVPRFEKISVRARDEKGRSIVIDAEGFLARVIQHELDHLDGKLFIDHVEDKEAVERELLALKDRLAQIALTGKWEQDDE